MNRRLLASAALALAIIAVAPDATWSAPPPTTWDDLVMVRSKRSTLVYLLPGADFRSYTKVMLDPTEVAFRKDWQREARVSDADAQRIVDLATKGFGEVFAKAYSEAGYQVVTTPGPDVLRLRTGVINLSIEAPERNIAGRSRTYSREAGEATLVLEVRDSTSGAILGRAVDRRVAGDMGPYLRSSVSNRADFEALFRTWAKTSIKGLAELKAKSPISPP